MLLLILLANVAVYGFSQLYIHFDSIEILTISSVYCHHTTFYAGFPLMENILIPAGS